MHTESNAAACISLSVYQQNLSTRIHLFHYLYFNFHFHLGDPPLVLEDYFLPKSGQHHHLKVYKTTIIINKSFLKNHNRRKKT